MAMHSGPCSLIRFYAATHIGAATQNFYKVENALVLSGATKKDGAGSGTGGSQQRIPVPEGSGLGLDLMKTGSARISRAVTRGGRDVAFVGAVRYILCTSEENHGTTTVCEILLAAGIGRAYVHCAGTVCARLGLARARYPLAPAEGCRRVLYAYARLRCHARGVLLTPASDQDRAKQEMERHPGHFARSVRTDPDSAGR